MAKDLFDRTIFDDYRVESLTESIQDIIPKYNFDGSKKLLYLFPISMMI